MKKVFIFADSFAIDNILYKFNEVTILSDLEICLCEHVCHNYKNQNIVVIPNITECLNNCDHIIVIESSEMPEDTLAFIRKISTEQGKRLIWLHNSWYNHIDENKLSFIKAPPKVPLIFSISFGLASQPYKLDMLIDKILISSNVRYKHVYCTSTYNLLIQFMDYNILNHSICKQLEYDSSCDELFVYHANINKFDELKQCKLLFENNIPDFIIAQVDNREYCIDHLNKLVCQIFGSQIDVILRSHFIKFIDHLIYCDNNQIPISTECVDLENIYHEKIVMERLFTKLAYPPEIHTI